VFNCSSLLHFFGKLKKLYRENLRALDENNVDE
jgi:hypothetical protein